jgi:hypothetical protein
METALAQQPTAIHGHGAHYSTVEGGAGFGPFSHRVSPRQCRQQAQGLWFEPQIFKRAKPCERKKRACAAKYCTMRFFCGRSVLQYAVLRFVCSSVSVVV